MITSPLQPRPALSHSNEFMLPVPFYNDLKLADDPVLFIIVT